MPFLINCTKYVVINELLFLYINDVSNLSQHHFQTNNCSRPGLINDEADLPTFLVKLVNFV